MRTLDSLAKEGLISKAQVEFLASGTPGNGVRPVLERAEWHKDGFIITADGYRLHKVSLPNDSGGGIPVIVDTKYGDVYFEGQYGKGTVGIWPNFYEVWPKHIEYSIELDSSSLLRGCKQCDVFARDNAHSMKVYMFERGVILYARSPEYGDVEYLIPGIKNPKIDMKSELGALQMERSINVTYVLDFLKTSCHTKQTRKMDADTILFQHSGTYPFILENNRTKDSALIMQMAVRE